MKVYFIKGKQRKFNTISIGIEIETENELRALLVAKAIAKNNDVEFLNDSRLASEKDDEEFRKIILKITSVLYG